MATLRVLVDGREFEAKMEPDTTSEDCEKAANELGPNVSELSYMAIGLVDGSYLVLGERQLERTLFVFVP